MPSARAQRLRAGALVAVGAYAVHQLRFALAGGGAGDPARAGHAYLGGVRVVLALALAAAGGQLLLRIVRARRSGNHAERAAASTPVTALAASLVLAAVFAAQELTEGLLSPGHPLGVTGVLGHGGWVALPLCAAFGALVALALRGARTLLDRAARGAAPRAHAPTARPVRHVARRPFLRLTAMASGGPGRAPPRRRPAPAP